jgi:hypothetical protein
MSKIAAASGEGQEDQMIQKLDLFLEIIEHELSTEYVTQDFIKASLRGFVMLFQMSDMLSYNYFKIYY